VEANTNLTGLPTRAGSDVLTEVPRLTSRLRRVEQTLRRERIGLWSAGGLTIVALLSHGARKRGLVWWRWYSDGPQVTPADR